MCFQKCFCVFFAFCPHQHFCRWPIFSTRSTPCLTVSQTNTTFLRLSPQSLIPWKGETVPRSLVWFAGWQSERHTHDCVGSAGEKWGQARPRSLSVTLTLIYLGSWCLDVCFQRLLQWRWTCWTPPPDFELLTEIDRLIEFRYFSVLVYRQELETGLFFRPTLQNK